MINKASNEEMDSSSCARCGLLCPIVADVPGVSTPLLSLSHPLPIYLCEHGSSLISNVYDCFYLLKIKEGV